MHTTVIKTKYYGEVRIHHNGDWSGEVIIHWHEYMAPEKKRTTEMPADLLLALGKDAALEYIKTELSSALDSLYFPEPPR